MAQHITDESRRMESREAHELELLLEEEEQAVSLAENKRDPLKKLLLALKFPKEWTLVTAITILAIAGFSAIGYWIGGGGAEKSASITQFTQNSVRPTPYIEPQYIFVMKPFFLPKKENGRETGEFIRVSINLQLSDLFLNREVKKVLPLIRQNVYTILKRKRSKKFYRISSQAEETLKREILTASNSLLISGSGTIKDVFFTEFLIRS